MKTVKEQNIIQTKRTKTKKKKRKGKKVKDVKMDRVQQHKQKRSKTVKIKKSLCSKPPPDIETITDHTQLFVFFSFFSFDFVLLCIIRKFFFYFRFIFVTNLSTRLLYCLITLLLMQLT